MSVYPHFAVLDTLWLLVTLLRNRPKVSKEDQRKQFSMHVVILQKIGDQCCKYEHNMSERKVIILSANFGGVNARLKTVFVQQKYRRAMVILLSSQCRK